MAKKVVLITGASRGIGFQTALELAHRNWKVILADKADLTAAKHSITIETCNKDLICKYVDLSSNTSIRSLVKDISCCEERLDVLINNAGIYSQGNATLDASEKTVLQVNYLGPFLLTYLLSDLLKKSNPSRIVFIGSSGAFLSNIYYLENLKPKSLEAMRPVNRYFIYNYSKLLVMVASKEFSKRLRKSNVTVNCVHPGMTDTNLLKQDDPSITSHLFLKVLPYVTQAPKKSGKLIAFMATAKTLENISGQYFENFRIHETPKIVEDSIFCQEIWKESEKLIKQEMDKY